MHFLHLADIHLGNQQYNSSERFNDFGLAFEKAICYGIQHQVDAILIAGDLFHKAAVEPYAYIQATDILSQARKANIPIIAVVGNHDQARYRDQTSWCDVLAHEGYLILLDGTPKEEIAELTAWNGQHGGYVDVGHVRVIGLPWLGSAASVYLPELAQAIKVLPQDGINCTVLLTHAGLEGEMPNIPGCLTYAQLEPFQAVVNYLALGHLHKKFVTNGWIYNPGSLEVCGMDEREWPKGWYDVTISPVGKITAHHVVSDCRPFYRLTFSVDRYQTPASLYRALRDHLRQHTSICRNDSYPAVVEVSLGGTLEFDRADLDTAQIEQAIKDELAPLIARVSFSRDFKLRGIEITADEAMSPAELEISVLREIALSNSQYATHPDAWAKTMLEIKELALANKDPRMILQVLQTRMDEIKGAINADHKA